MSRRRFSVNDLVSSQSEACDASVPRGAKMPKRAAQSGEKVPHPKGGAEQKWRAMRAQLATHQVAVGKTRDAKKRNPSLFTRS